MSQTATSSVTTIAAETIPAEAMKDLSEGFMRYDMWWRFAIHDIKQRFRRSLIGPLWLTLSMGITIGAMGVVFSTISHMRIDELLPYIAVGLIFWGFLTACIGEGSTALIQSVGYLKNVPMQLSIHVYRMIARNLIILGFNLVIYVFMLFTFPHPGNFNYLLVIPGFALFLANVGWISISLAVLSARYRDVPQVVGSVIQVIFFVTPIFWSAQTFPSRPMFIALNPAYHMLEVVRAPLLGGRPGISSWVAVILCAVVGWILTLVLYRRAYPRVAYWV